MAAMVMTAGQDPGLVLVECVDCDEWFAAAPSLAAELAQIVAVLHVCEPVILTLTYPAEQAS